ncbi:GEVED domain-containing protein [Isoptericola jiangsuensis]|uniref:DUF7927 domain-containing protein n=1 Tax=Isoptericola jiangsuensis TaxID=548579 RepID=UPI003AAAA459
MVIEPLAEEALPQAAAVPGNPGVMEAPSDFYFENFENVTWQEPDEAGAGSNSNDWDAGDFVQTLTEFPYGADGSEENYQPGYVNADGVTTYTADNDWAAGNYCNGIIVATHGAIAFAGTQYDSPRPQYWADPLLNPTDGCIPTGNQSDNTWWNRLRAMSNAMGQWHQNAKYPYLDQVEPQDASENHIVSSYTNAGTGNTVEPGAMLEFEQPLPVDPGRYYQFSIDVASQSCNVSGAVGAQPQFLLTQADGSTTSAFSSPVNTCDIARDAAYGMVLPAASVSNQSRQTRIGTFLGDTSLRSTGDSIGVQIVNQQAGANGNDTAFDNIVILDTTPKIDKEFSTGPYPVGTDATLTYTVTNTYDPLVDESTPSGPKEDFSFTDVFNSEDLVLTGDAETTCGDGVVTAEAGTGTVSLEGGDLVDPDLVTCTITVGVTSDTVGTYTNGPDDFTELFGLNPPGDTDVTFIDDAFQCDAGAYLFQNTPVDAYGINLITGDAEEIASDFSEQGINGVGYNTLDDYLYGSLTGSSPTEIVRITASGEVQNLGTPGNWSTVGSPQTIYNVGEFDEEGHLWLANGGSASPLYWVELDMNPDSSTYFEVLDSGQVGFPGVSAGVYDWGFDPGTSTFLAMTPATAGGPRIVRFDPANGSLTVVGVPGQLVGPNGVANPQTSAWGAAYTTPDGYLYMSNNNTGQIWRIDMADPTTAEFFSYGPPSSSNDGTRCPTAPLPIDYGDAPDSYDTLLASGGPFHGVTNDPDDPLLTIGDSVTTEVDGQPDASAALDEDDAFTQDPVVSIDSAETSLSVPITNDSDVAAALVGWIDFDLSGTFEEDERSEVDTGTGSGNDNLTWNVPADAVPGASYLRLRAALLPPDGLPTDTSEVGPGVDTGEVEDWPVELVELPVDYGDAPDSYGTLAESGGASHAVVDHDETTSTAPLMLGDENTVDTEDDGVPTAGADGDDLAGVDDESSITEPVTAELGQDVTLDVLATNDTTTDATLVAWMDGDQNGTFDPGEASTAVTVPAGSGSDTYPVTLPAASVLGESYLRVRLFDGANDDPQPTGSWTGGEVEDYVVTVVEPELTVVKTSDAGETVSPGDVVTYTVTVENTGTADYTDPEDPASLTDDLSDVLDDATYNGDAAVDPDQGTVDFTDPTLTWSGPLAVGETVTLTYSVTVDDPPGGDGVLSNTVVAPDSTCDPDVDPADPDCTTTTPVRSLEIVKTSDAVTTLTPGQDIEYSFTVTNTGGYDYTADDPATADDDLSAVLDDAVYNNDAAVDPDQGTVGYAEPVLSWSGPLAAGESVTITYTVTVNDPLSGDGELLNVVEGPPESNCDPDAVPADPDCTVVLPAPGLDIAKTATPSSDPLLPGGTVTYTVEVTNTGAADYTDAAPADFTDDLSGVLDDATYNDDAAVDPDQGTVDVSGTELSWFGPLAAGETVTITYSVTVNDPVTGDAELTNVILGPPESNCPEGSVDPDCTTTTPVAALDVSKVVDFNGEVEPGDTVAYTITVENIGGVDFTDVLPAEVSDDLSEVLDDATWDDDVTVVPDQGTVSFTDPVLSWSGPLAVGEQVQITYTVTVDDPLEGDGVLTNAVVGGDCPDPAVTDPADPAFDPECVTSTPVAALDVSKVVDFNGEVEPGGTVAYTITVENIGGVDFTDVLPAEVSDDLSEVLDDATWDDDAAVAPDQGAVDFTDPTLTWSGPLAAGETVTITYSVTVDDPLEGDGVLTNAVVGGDCPDPAVTDPADPAFDPECVTTTPVRALEIVKTFDAETEVQPGDTVGYTVEVTNAGGVDYTLLDPATATDDLSDVLDDATYNGDAAADAGSVAFADPNLTWSGPLPVGETVTITYSVTVDDPPGGDGVLTNTVTGPPESTCVDGTEEGCTTTTPVASLEVVKTSDSPTGVVAGDQVTYTIEVTNTGGFVYTVDDPAVVSDDLTEVLDDATWDDAVTLDPDQGTVDFTDPTLSWSGPLDVGETVTITYSVTVNDPVSGDGVLTNAVVGGDCPDPAVTDPDDPAFDPDCSTEVPVLEPGLTVEKTSDAAGEVLAGDTVEYTITLENTGEVDYTLLNPATLADDLSDVLDDAALDEDSIVVDPDQGTVDFTDPVLSWSGPLAVGETVTITYSVTVDDPPTGDGVLTNTVVVPGSECPEGSQDPDCTVTDPIKALEIVKTSDAAEDVAPGDTITYTVEITNSGQVGYTEPDDLATFTDDLSGVLDDATFDTGSIVVDPDQGTAGFTDPELTWSGPLAVGETVSVTYSVTLDDPPTGDSIVANAVVGPPESNCDPDQVPEDPNCSTTTPSPAVEIVKTSDAAGEVVPGDVVTYTVEVTNSGAVAFTDDDPLVVTDDLSGVLDDATYNDDAAADPDSGTFAFADPNLTWTGPLAVGETVSLTYSVTVDDPPGLLADGELTNAVSAPGSNCVQDADPADPDCTTTTPVRSVEIVKTSDAAGEVLPGDTVEYTVTITNTGGVDYVDPDSLLTISDDLSGVLDDAAYNDDAVVDPDQGTADFTDPTLTWTGPLAVDETVTITYSVTVDDPLPDDGDGVLTNAVTGPPESTCVDGTDPGCTTTTPVRSVEIVKTSDAAGEVLPGDTVEYTVTVTNTGGVDYVDPDSLLTISDDLSGVLDDASYNDDAVVDPDQGAVGFTDPTLSWSGPLAVGETVTITYSVTVDDPLPDDGDGVLTNAVTGPPESTCVDGTDPGCTTTTPVRSLDVVKSSDAAGEVLPGDTVEYTIEVTNTGGADYTVLDPAEVFDDLTEVLDDATFGDISTDPTPPDAEFDGDSISWSGPLAAGESVTITYTVTVNDPLTGDGVLDNTVVGPPESGCDPAQDPADPDCTVTVPVRAVEIVKTSDPVTGVAPGEEITYTVAITNTGGADYADPDSLLTVTDDLSAVLDDATLDEGSIVVDPDQGTASFTDPTLTWTGPLAVGETVEITYTLTVNDPPSGDGTMTNFVVGPPESNCDENADPVDPNCSTEVPVLEPGLGISKTSDAGDELLPGDTVTYTVTVENTGEVDYTDADPAVVSDDLTDVLDDATYNGDAAVDPDQGAVDFTDPTLTWTGPLAVGETVTITYSVTAGDPLPEDGDGVLTNAVTGPPESTCVEGTEEGCTTTTPVRALEIVKTSDAAGEVLPGDTVTYEVTVTNTGGFVYTDADPAVVSDDLSDVLDDATYNDDAGVDPDQGAVDFTDPTLTWSGPLAAGETVTITYSVTVDDPLPDDGDGVLTNAVTGPPESTCVEGTEEGCTTTTPVRALEIVKTSDAAGEVLPGDTVTYEVTVTNTGGFVYTDADPAVVSDDLSEVLDDATYNEDAVVDPDQGAVDFADPTLSWTGPLAAGESVTITYSVTVDDPPAGDGVLTNAILGPPESNCVEDADPADPNCSTTTPVRALEIVKTFDAETEVQPGDTVGYTVEVTNTGGVDYTLLDPATATDDLSDVLDDATYNGDAAAGAGSVAFADPLLAWSGPLPVGETVTITYSVTVGDPLPDDGDGVLTNAVTGPPESTCVDGTEEGCTTTTPVASLEVVKTSDSPTGVVAGDQVTYTIEVTNTGGFVYTVDDPAVVSDDLTEVLDDATWDDAVTLDPDQGTVDFTDPTLSWSGPLDVGETVTITYSVTVNDPVSGDGVLTNAVVGGDCPDPAVTDPDDPAFDPDCSTEVPVLEPGLTVEKTSDAAGEVLAGDTVEYTITLENTGEVDYTLLNPATLADDLSGVLDDAALDEDSIVVDPDQGTVDFTDPVLSWSGPLAVGETVTITYSVTVDDPPTGDGVLTNTVVVPGSDCPEGSQDPDCTVTDPIRALEIVKTSDAAEDVAPGDTITYTVEITNSGQVDYTDPDDLATFTDDLSGVLDDASFDTGSIVVDPDQGAAGFTDPELTWSGPLAVGETVSVTYSVTLDDPPAGDSIVENAVVGPPESNCDPDQVPEDPNCSTSTPTPAVEIVKTSDAAGEVVPGDVVAYTVEVTNSGAVAFTDDDPLVVTDDLSDVLDDATYNDDAAADPDSGTFAFADPYLAWSGPLDVGETVSLTYSVTVDDPPGLLADGELTNAVSAPGSNCVQDADPADPDCTTTTPVRSVEIVKTSDAAGEVLPGDTVEYTVEITNTGGVDYADPDSLLTVSDDLSGVLDDATYNDDAGVDPDQGAVDFTDPTLTWSGPLAAGETVTITYSVTVDDPLPDDGDGVLTNAVTGPPESTCVDPEDPGCTTTTPVRALEIVKTSDAAGEVLPGDTVTYEVTVTNTGGFVYTDADPAVVSDDLSGVLDDASYNDDAAVAPDQGAVDFTDPTLSWSGPLAAGESVTITYSVTVDDPPAGDGVLTNAILGPPESNCVEDADPADPNCSTTTPVRALEIVKTSDTAGEVQAGDTVGYTVEVTNTGGMDYTDADPATATDDLSDVLDDATYNGDAAAGAGSVAFADPLLAWSGPLPVGETVTITYSVTVGDPLPDDGDGVLTNAVTGPPESTCVDPEEPGCTTTTPVRALEIVKTSDAAGEVLPGDTVSYEVTVTNTGGFVYTDADPAVVSDDLSDVLDDASYNDDAAVAPDQGAVDFADASLTWEGPLAAGESVTITYSLTVNDPVSGDGVLTNTVTGPPESTCVEGTEEGCTVTDPVRQLDIVKTVTDPVEPIEALAPGDEITYSVEITNTGGFDYTAEDPAFIEDDMTNVLDDATLDEASITIDPDVGEVTFDDPVLRWEGPLAVGDEVTITYTVEVDDPLAGDGVLVNSVTGPPEGPCVEGNEDGCTVSVPGRDIDVTKSASPETTLPGGTVEYTVEVTNTGTAPYTDASPAQVIDDLTNVLDDATYNEDATVDPEAGTLAYVEPYLAWYGPLEPGETVTITYSVTVGDPLAEDGDGVLDNIVHHPGPCPGGFCAPEPPNPPEQCEDGLTEDGQPCGATSTPVRELDIVKSVATESGEDWTGPTQDVTYSVTVENTGAGDYTADDPAIVADDLSDVLDDATLDEDSIMVGPDQGEVTFDDPILSWSGPLAAGESVTITYTVSVSDTVSGDGDLVNVVTGPPESSCVDGTEEGCTTETPVRALEIVKTSDAGDEVMPGQTVGYTVEVTNTGTFVYTDDDPAVVTDDLSAVLDDATYDDDAAADPDVGTLDYTAPELTWTGPIEPGQTVMITYSVTVDDPDTGDGVLDNVVSGPPESTCAVDPSMSPAGMSAVVPITLPTLLAAFNPDCSTSVPVVEPSSPEPSAPGSPGTPPATSPPSGFLPRTGAEWVALASVALALIVAGGLLYGVRRRTGREDD